MVFEVMHIFNTERVELDTYQFKNVARNWFEQLKMDRAEGAQPASSTCFKEAFQGCFFPRDLREAKVREFLTLKQDTLSVHKYGINFTQLYRYAQEMVANIRRKMSFCFWVVASVKHRRRAAMIIKDMYIPRLMAYVQ